MKTGLIAILAGLCVLSGVAAAEPRMPAQPGYWSAEAKSHWLVGRWVWTRARGTMVLQIVEVLPSGHVLGSITENLSPYTATNELPDDGRFAMSVAGPRFTISFGPPATSRRYELALSGDRLIGKLIERGGVNIGDVVFLRE